MRRAEVVRGLEPLSGIDVHHARSIHSQFDDVVPAIWERAFHELLGCFKSSEASIKAFRVLDTDGNGLVDSREMLGALAILSRGHLTERMTLLFDIFDLNREKEMGFDECFLMIRRTLKGLRKMVGIHEPPEKVIQNMTKQVWRAAQKHRDVCITNADWFAWWSSDASCRNGLKIFVWKPEELRGLPTPDHFVNVDYAKGADDTDAEPTPLRLASRGSSGPSSPPSSRHESKQPSAVSAAYQSLDAKPRQPSFLARVDNDGDVSRPVYDDAAAAEMEKSSTSRNMLELPGHF